MTMSSSRHSNKSRGPREIADFVGSFFWLPLSIQILGAVQELRHEGLEMVDAVLALGGEAASLVGT